MTDPAFRIRLMEGRDIPTVVSLDRQVFADSWPESAFVQEIYFNPSAHYFVLELLDPRRALTWHSVRRRRAAWLVGFVGMRVEGTRGHISTLAVLDEWRGRRLGEMLLLTAIDRAVRDGAQSIGLEVRVSNAVAQALYAKYGFMQRSLIQRYYADGEDALYLQVALEGNPGYVPRVIGQLAALGVELQLELVLDAERRRVPEG